jgi:hypothetical protein
MKFNIIYTPNSIRYLSHFVANLISHLKNEQLWLISNNCSLKERAIIKKLIKKNPSANFSSFPTHQTQHHGKVLDYLQAMNQEEYFCFMDSDIFALSELPDLEKMMRDENLTGLFSAMPLWVKKTEYVFKENFKSMVGTFNQSENGQCIGSSYFAIYRSKDLYEIMQYYGVSFEETATVNLPFEIQQKLKIMGFHQSFFDTGKVINLLLAHHGYKLKNIELTQLCHIGGTSYETTYKNQKLTRKQKLLNWLNETPLKVLVKKVAAHKMEQHFKKRFENMPNAEYRINYNQRILHRNITRKHFLNLFLALSENKPIPVLPQFKDKEIFENVKAAHEDYIQMFKKIFHLNQF